MWTAEEDKRIREAVLHHGLKNPNPNPKPNPDPNPNPNPDPDPDPNPNQVLQWLLAPAAVVDGVTAEARHRAPPPS